METTICHWVFPQDVDSKYTHKLNCKSTDIWVGILKHSTTLTNPYETKEKKTQITNFRNERGDITIDATEIKKIIRDYYK